MPPHHPAPRFARCVGAAARVLRAAIRWQHQCLRCEWSPVECLALLEVWHASRLCPLCAPVRDV